MTTPRQTGKGRPFCAPVAIAALAIGLTAAADRTVFGQCTYSVQEVLPPPCQFGASVLRAHGMNNLGHVVGYFTNCETHSIHHPFLWIDGEITVFPNPKWAARTHFTDINDHGLITGYHVLPDGLHGVGFVFNWQTGEQLEFGPKHGIGGSWANAINNAGIVAGTRTIAQKGDPWPWPHNAVIWDTNTGKITDLGVMNGPNSEATALNDDGTAVGWTGSLTLFPQAWRYADGKVEVLGPIPFGLSSIPRSLNQHGVIAGNGLINQSKMPGSTSQPARWDGGWKLLGLLPGHTAGGAWGINDVDQVVGTSTGSSGSRAFLWQNHQMFDLHDLVEGFAGTITNGQSVNNAGMILTRINNVRGGLLTPQDVPLGDLNYDCRVDVHDLWIMFEQWGPVSRSRGVGNGPSADLNGDGVVNVTDLLILFDNWTN